VPECSQKRKYPATRKCKWTNLEFKLWREAVIKGHDLTTI